MTKASERRAMRKKTEDGQGVAGTLFALAGRVGAYPGESSETALQRRLVVMLSVGGLRLTPLCPAIYLWAGAPLAAAVPAIYSVVTPVNTLLLAWSRRLGFYRFV